MISEASKDLLLITLKKESHNYDLVLSTDELERLAAYYEVLHTWNSRLHLVAPCSAKEFATRHLLESIFLTRHLFQGALVTDVGSGGGLPMIPCLIKRPDLVATLVEASKKKSVFLKEALKVTGTNKSATVVAERFENLSQMKTDFVTCRALDKFEDRLPQLIDWTPQRAQLLLYGGPSIKDELRQLGLEFTKELLPKSERRYLFVVEGEVS